MLSKIINFSQQITYHIPITCNLRWLKRKSKLYDPKYLITRIQIGWYETSVD